MGSLIIGSAGIIVSMAVLLLPRVIPRTEKPETNRSTQNHETYTPAEKNHDDPVFGKR